jgi:isopentenyl diphosphate isomerase/L-lactate dehydrogenase-like FMN-dependent dehydrogenase
MSVEDHRKIAREKMKGHCGVYKHCDGADVRICQRNAYGKGIGFGGVGSGQSFQNNYNDLKDINLKMRVIGENYTPNTEYEFFGNKLTMPIMGASVTGVNSFGGDSVITEPDFCKATVLGAKQAGTIGWRGDTYTYDWDFMPCYDAICNVAEGWGVKISKPRDQETLKKVFKMYEEGGAIAVGTDVDGSGSTIMAAHNKPVFKKSPEDIKELVASTKLPVIIKGIMTVEDAVAVADTGAAAIVVSNHGGRVLDHTPGTAAVLPPIVDAVKGKIKILVDGGIRNGYDVLKMLAIGAESVLVGRDIVRAAVGGGAEGVKVYFELMQKTLAKAMKMTNAPTLDDITRDIIYM